jgi:hypothetical protein
LLALVLVVLLVMGVSVVDAVGRCGLLVLWIDVVDACGADVCACGC